MNRIINRSSCIYGTSRYISTSKRLLLFIWSRNFILLWKLKFHQSQNPHVLYPEPLKTNSYLPTLQTGYLLPLSVSCILRNNMSILRRWKTGIAPTFAKSQFLYSDLLKKHRVMYSVVMSACKRLSTGRNTCLRFEEWECEASKRHEKRTEGKTWMILVTPQKRFVCDWLGLNCLES
jgi:hypothetical protein